jgi:acetylornithine aminotransferase
MEFARGKNSYLWDNTEKKQLGLVVGITMCGTNNCNPAVTVAICKQKQTLIHRSNLYYVLGGRQNLLQKCWKFLVLARFSSVTWVLRQLIWR